ncbi:YoaK family protein [Rhodococcus sp. 1163]|uniref:YoaK family protein n=1 Tax=Rhodococcus sp. 1163 TaxID=1905289 RepID=UPI002119C6C1|nr:YoaK family protein [Rhodococcus sp. 1163]
MDFLWAALANDDTEQRKQIDMELQKMPSRVSGLRVPVGGDSVGLWLMLALTFVTGVVDAVGFLGLDRVFTGNMTGNIVILGMGIAGADELPVLGPGVALVAFAAGAFLSGLLLRNTAPGWQPRTTTLLGIGGVVLAVLVGVFLVLGEDPAPNVKVVIAACIATVMGEQAAVARRLAIKDMTTVVVTSTLTSLAGETFVVGGWRAVWNRRFGAIVIIFLGAVVGALLLRVHIAVPLSIAAVLTLAVAALGHRHLHAAPGSAQR